MENVRPVYIDAAARPASAAERYTQLAVWLHWLLALALFGQIGLGLYMADIPKGTPERAWYFNLHKSIGLTLFAFILLRLWWRSLNSPPPLPGTMPTWERKVARANHIILYVCMLVMPVSGFIASNFTKYGVKFFGLFQIGPWGWDDKAIYSVFNGLHETTGTLFIALITIHVLAALKHWLLDRDRVLQRMLP
jgi:cytochrome b561